MPPTTAVRSTRSRRKARTAGVLAAALAFAGAGAVIQATAASASSDGSLVMGPQAMEGNLIVSPGTTLLAGYDFTIPGSHPATKVEFVAPSVTFVVQCVSGAGGGTFTVDMPSASYSDPAGSPDWLPSGDQHSTLVYEGSVSVPDLCGGGLESLNKGGTFQTTVEADQAQSSVHVRWHYSANGTSGSWSGTASVNPAPLSSGGGSNG